MAVEADNLSMKLWAFSYLSYSSSEKPESPPAVTIGSIMRDLNDVADLEMLPNGFIRVEYSGEGKRTELFSPAIIISAALHE